MKIVPVILCGGMGTRLWPVSRELYPKHLLTIMNDKSLLQETMSRSMSCLQAENPILVCSEETQFLVERQVEEVGITPETIILEPVSRDTAPAIALAAYHASLEEDTLLVVFPSDHFIRKELALYDSLENAISLAKKDNLVTLGVHPARAETGYGYIRVGGPLGSGYEVQKFIEKPDLESARAYVGSDEYYWNSGIFVFKASNYLCELRNQRPAIAEATRHAMQKSIREAIFTRVCKKSFDSCPRESIDYAVMEHTSKAAMVPLEADWGDLGSWHAIWEVTEHDTSHNTFVGDVVSEDVSNSYIRADHRLVSAVGVDNLILIETADAVLVTTQDNAQNVKKIVSKLRQNEREESQNPAKIQKPWGHYERIGKGFEHQVKNILVSPGASLSLQKHVHRSEHWIIVSGTATVTLGDTNCVLKKNESIFIPAGTLHRLANFGETPLEVIEVQIGTYLGEDDIIRFDDQYGRDKLQFEK